MPDTPPTKTKRKKRDDILTEIKAYHEKKLKLQEEHNERRAKYYEENLKLEKARIGALTENNKLLLRILTEFWALTDHTRQWDFIRNVKQLEKKQITATSNAESRRNFSREYYFDSGM